MAFKHAHIINQRTLVKSISYVGIGLHTGKKVKMIVKPAEENTGIVFIRTDIKDKNNIVFAHWSRVVNTTLSTVIGNNDEITVGTIEHLMAALSGCGVDNALIEIDGPEVPIMDGSAAPFVSVIEQIGTIDQTVSRNAILINRPVEVREGDKYSILMPSYTPRITVEIDFEQQVIGSQTFSVALVNEAFRKNIARARTFGFSSELQQLRHQGLAKGGSLKNAVLVDGERIVNDEGLRFENEFVRHKILDAMGDLALLGVPVIGHLYGYKIGHKLNNLLIKQLLSIPDAWSYTTMADIYSLIGDQTDKHSKQIEVVRRQISA